MREREREKKSVKLSNIFFLLLNKKNQHADWPWLWFIFTMREFKKKRIMTFQIFTLTDLLLQLWIVAYAHIFSLSIWYEMSCVIV